jgi:hypothetical protein
MKDDLHEKERQENLEAFPVIEKRTFVLLKILNSGKCYCFLNNNLSKPQAG